MFNKKKLKHLFVLRETVFISFLYNENFFFEGGWTKLQSFHRRSSKVKHPELSWQMSAPYFKVQNGKECFTKS